MLKPEVLNLIEGDQTSWESDPLSRLANDGQLAAFKHEGFWQPMDTLREKNLLNDLWNIGRALENMVDNSKFWSGKKYF